MGRDPNRINRLKFKPKAGELFQCESISWIPVTCPKCGEKCVMPDNQKKGSRIHMVKKDGSKCGGRLK